MRVGNRSLPEACKQISQVFSTEREKLFSVLVKATGTGIPVAEILTFDGISLGKSIGHKYNKDFFNFEFDITFDIHHSYLFKLYLNGINVAFKPHNNPKEITFIDDKFVKDISIFSVFRYVNLNDFSISGLISVVIPHFRCSDYLFSTLDSLSKQSYSGIEVIVVDDGSPDVIKAWEIVESFVDKFNSLFFIALLENRGAPVARNVGANMSKGEYLFFLDADCVLREDCLERLLNGILFFQSDFSYGGFRWGEHEIPAIDFDLDLLRRRNYISTMSLVRRKVFPGFDETLKRHQDWDLWLTIVERGGFGVCVGDLLFETPMRVNSISDYNNLPMSISLDIIRRKHHISFA